MRVPALVILIAALVGCGRATQFLHHIKDIPPKVFEGVHKLKELQGENRVDILWVIDNSGSMGTYHQDLLKNADMFISDFVSKSGLDWRMGILSTSPSEDPYLGFTPTTLLTHQTPDAVKIFNDAVEELGTDGDVTEQTFVPVEKHLNAYPTFLRRQATLALIMLTDAKEQSQVPAKNFLNFLSGKKGGLRQIVSYGVFASTDFGCTQTDEPGGWNYAGSPYEEVINATKGKVYKLCNTNFGANLADLGKDLISRIQRPFIQLEDRPVSTTIRVVYKGEDLLGGSLAAGGKWLYDFDLNRIVFHSLDFAPTDQEEVTVVYQVADDIAR